MEIIRLIASISAVVSAVLLLIDVLMPKAIVNVDSAACLLVLIVSLVVLLVVDRRGRI